MVVRDWYQSFLGRPDSHNDALFWVNQILHGETLEAVLHNSWPRRSSPPSANNLIGGTNPDDNFVRALYLLQLNRSPATNDVNFWVSQVQSLGRQAVALAFLETAEFRTDMIASFYTKFLHRDADDDGLRFWVRSNLDLLTVEMNILASGEFFSDD